MKHWDRIRWALAGASLALPALAAWGLAQTPPPGVRSAETPHRTWTWVESVALRLGLARETTERVENVERRREAAQALLHAHLDTAICARIKDIPLDDNTSAGSSAREWCAVYNDPGLVEQTQLEWNRSALSLAGVMLAALLIGLAGSAWFLYERRALRRMRRERLLHRRHTEAPPKEAPRKKRGFSLRVRVRIKTGRKKPDPLV